MGNGLKSIFDLIQTSFRGEDSRLDFMSVWKGKELELFELTLESYLLDMMTVRMSFFAGYKAQRRNKGEAMFPNRSLRVDGKESWSVLILFQLPKQTRLSCLELLFEFRLALLPHPPPRT